MVSFISINSVDILKEIARLDMKQANQEGGIPTK